MVVSLTPTSLEPVIVVEFPTYNWPPTALTVSFSNTAVLSVPRIVTCSNSALPLPADDILQPLTPVWNVDVSNTPVEFITKLFEEIVPLASVHPPIVPLVEVIAPAAVTLNTELAPNAIPSVPK